MAVTLAHARTSRARSTKCRNTTSLEAIIVMSRHIDRLRRCREKVHDASRRGVMRKVSQRRRSPSVSIVCARNGNVRGARREVCACERKEGEPARASGRAASAPQRCHRDRGRGLQTPKTGFQRFVALMIPMFAITAERCGAGRLPRVRLRRAAVWPAPARRSGARRRCR